MSDTANAFLATVLYTDHDGAEHTIGALVLAVDEMDAIEAAIEAVSSLPHCARVDGGMLEPAPAGFGEAPNAREETRATRPAGATVH